MFPFFSYIQDCFWCFQNYMYRVVTSARSCNKVGHLLWFTGILAQHEANDVILYIYNVYRRRSSFLKLEDYKMRSKQVRLNWTNSMQVKKLLFTNVLLSGHSACEIYFKRWYTCIPQAFLKYFENMMIDHSDSTIF